jgi:hypothetical protein
MSGYTSVDPSEFVLLQGTAALQCKGGIIGGSAGAAYDTVLFGAYIQLNATAAVLTIAGLIDTNGAAQNLIITGETTTDYFWMPPAPILNRRNAFVFTPSVAGKIWVATRAYVGPESPQ